MTNLRIILIIILGLSLAACGKKDAYLGMNAEQIYAEAQKNMKKENYARAVQDYEALEARHPYGEFSEKSQLDLVYAYYKKNDPNLAITSADRFIRMNPRHPRVDYAFYLKGLVAFDQNMSFMYRHLPLDRSLRDSSSAKASFDAFKELLERYPNSQYADDARQRMVYLRDQLARHELQAVKYYMKRGAYLSAANRANYIIKNFDQTSAVNEALINMREAYAKLGMQDLSHDAEKVLQQNQ